MRLMQRLREWLAARKEAKRVKCPKCGSTLLQQYGLGSFSKTFMCINGHHFTIDSPGP